MTDEDAGIVSVVQRGIKKLGYNMHVVSGRRSTSFLRPGGSLRQFLLLAFCSFQPCRHRSQFRLKPLILLGELHDITCPFLHNLHAVQPTASMMQDANEG